MFPKRLLCLLKEVLNAKNIPLTFQSGDNIDLILGVREGKHAIDVVILWNTLFQIGEYTSEQEARREYNNYLGQLKQGYGIHITSNRTAEIIEPK